MISKPQTLSLNPEYQMKFCTLRWTYQRRRWRQRFVHLRPSIPPQLRFFMIDLVPEISNSYLRVKSFEFRVRGQGFRMNSNFLIPKFQEYCTSSYILQFFPVRPQRWSSKIQTICYTPTPPSHTLHSTPHTLHPSLLWAI